MTDEFLTQKQLAELLHQSLRTIERWRTDGEGPVFTKAGRRVLYRQSDIDEWLNQRRFADIAAAKEAGCR